MSRKRLPKARCPNPLHREARPAANGTRIIGGRRVRQYRCAPALEPIHTFLVTVADNRPVVWQPMPACPRHLDASVKRNGMYGPDERRRQIYRCRPADGDPAHNFTPVLPRAHVDADSKPCSECSEQRGLHHGETAAARRHRWSTKIVARGLERLSLGMPYGKVSRKALEEIDAPIGAARRQSPKTTDVSAKKISPRSRESHLVWHIAADWVESFAPVIWEPIEADLRETARTERARLDAAIAAGQPLERPQVIVIDDKPIWSGQGSRRKRRDEGFHVLVVSEVSWEKSGPRLRLRLARAMAKSTTAAWRLIFDELGYAPDFVVSDADTAILAAVRAHYPASTHLIPSLHHLSEAIERGLNHPDVVRHLALLSRDGALGSLEAWRQWWEDLSAMVGPDKKFDGLRANYEEAMAAVLPDIIANPGLPVANAGVEVQIREEVNRVLYQRSQFANIERTNHLFDLMVAQAHGAFTHLDVVAQQLRDDAAAHDGWTVALRSIDDPRGSDRRKPYSSLRDANLIDDLAAERGLR